MALLKNFATSTVAVAPSPATTGTSVTVASGHGSRFVAGHPVIVCSSSGADPDTSEVWMLDDIVGDVFTITREHESTSARTVEVGDIVMQGPTAGMLNYPKYEGAATVAATTLSGTEIDVTKDESVKALTGDVTVTLSATPPAGRRLKVTFNADSTARTVTLPAGIYSIQRQGVVGSVVVPANGTLLLGLRYTGARWEVLGDPAATVGSGSYELATNNKVLSFGVGDVGGSTAVALNAITGYIRIPWACTVVGGTWAVQANGSSPTCTVDILRVASGTALPSASFVGTGTKPAIASGNAATGATTDWQYTTFASGDLVAAKVTATSGVATWIGLQLTISRT